MSHRARTSRVSRSGRRRLTLAASFIALGAGPVLAGPSLTAHAGLATHAKAGRWMPVEIVLESTAPVTGTISASWGGATATRELDLPAGARTAVSLTLRTGDPRSSATVTLRETSGSSTLTVPVMVDPDDTPIVACVDGAVDVACTVTLTAGQASSDWRAYDVADEVRVGTAGSLDAAQRDAIARWAGRRQSESQFGLPADPSVLHASAPAVAVWPWLVGLLALPVMAWHAARGGPRVRGLVHAAAIAMAVGGALGAGRTGPRFRAGHDTTIHAFTGTAATIAESRLALRAGTEGPLLATLLAPGGWLSSTTPDTLNTEGLPVLLLDARFGATYRVQAEYPGPPSPVVVRPVAGGVAIENHGAEPLTGCSAPPTLDAAGATSIAPSAALLLKGTPGPGDSLRCQWHTAGPPLDANGLSLADASSLLLVHLGTVMP